MTENICTKCGFEAVNAAKLQQHLNRKTPCNKGIYDCDKCRFKSNNRTSIYAHRKICKGIPITKATLEKENESLKTVLAATGNQRKTNDDPSSSQTVITDSHDLTHSGHGDIVGRDQINHITNNITVNCAYKEDIDHLKDMSMEELRSKIGCLPDLTTHIRLFDLIRTSADHPENHTMLLPDIDGKTVHFKTEKGWQSAPYNQRMLEAFLTDNKFLIDKVPASKQDQLFYQGYLLGSNFRAKDDYLMPYYDACRKFLHCNTLKLAESHADFKRFDAAHLTETTSQASSSRRVHPPSLLTMTYQEAKDLEETKLKVAKEAADLEETKLRIAKDQLRIAKEMAELRMKERESEINFMIAKNQTSGLSF